jgi:hypothetical protein
MKSVEGFNSDNSFIDQFLASVVVHPHKSVANHVERARRTETQPYTGRQERAQNIIHINDSRYQCFSAGLRPLGRDPQGLRWWHTHPTKRNLLQITRCHLDFPFEETRCLATVHKKVRRCGRAFAARCAFFQKIFFSDEISVKKKSCYANRWIKTAWPEYSHSP